MISLLGISSLFCMSVHAEELSARKPLPKHIIRVPDSVDTSIFDYRLTVKFNDAWKVRATVNGDVVSKSEMDIDQTQNLIQQYGLQLETMIKLPAQRIADIEQRAKDYSGIDQPDLLGMMIVNIPAHQRQRIVELGEMLQNYPEVEYAYIETIGTPPPGDLGSTTPDYSPMQEYIGSDPGINMDYMYTLGITGTNVQVTDCEYGVNVDHEDLMDQGIVVESNQTVPSWVASNGWDDHGTAVVGEIAGANNGYGVSGLAHNVMMNFNPEYSNEEGGRRVGSIASAIDTSVEGDIVLLEMQAQASYVQGSYLYGPAELDPNVWTVTKTGTDSGIIIVAAAGNGDQDLDSSTYATYTSYGDSGAILVGAGSSDTLHDKLYFSTHGARVNVHAWGENVFTTGYGGSYTIDGDVNQEYTNGFNGTSSASPIVTSACAALQDYVLSNGNAPLSPSEMRQILMDTGISQGTGANIGVFPDLENAIAALDGDLDGWINPSYGGNDCDDANQNVNPDATDTWYDGIDSNCDGMNDYDQDGDGFVQADDCDDMDPTINPDATDTWYDGIDSNCDGMNDYDQDGDGETTSDHRIFNGCFDILLYDTYGDGWNGNTLDIVEDGTLVQSVTLVDGYSDNVQYCPSGNSQVTEWYFEDGSYNSEISFEVFDADGNILVTGEGGPGLGSTDLIVNGVIFSDGDVVYDMSFYGMDCEDTDSSINSTITEIWYDGIDSNCDGMDDYDQDMDGFVQVDDCDDMDVTINPDATDTWYDGIDSNCDGLNDYDQDGDGFIQADDCNDMDPTINPDATDTWYDGIDQDCDGTNDYDQDMDGYLSFLYGGSDCDDVNTNINPNAAEVWYDGIDANCDGMNDYDQDMDGFTDVAYGGDDCDDVNANINLNAADAWYDGIDSNCDGMDDYDQDMDGFIDTDDCNDMDANINPDATDTWYDGIDSNCDGLNDYDQDGDGYLSDQYGGTDCDDGNLDIAPGIEDTWYDGVDSNCDGMDDYDQDGDGFVQADDCDDMDANTNPSATDAWYDGVDSNCDGMDDYDQDMDGFVQVDDCDDMDANINPDATDTWYDGVDSDCDGMNDYDQDGDGYLSDEYGGLDCNDEDADISPDASEIEDGIDNDCDGADETFDADGDGLTDIEESEIGTSTTNPDTDGDGISDGDEVSAGTDPLVQNADSEEEDKGGCSTSGNAGQQFGFLALLALVGLRRKRSS